MFNDRVRNTDLDWAPGQKARVLSVWDEEDGVFGVKIDWKEFEDDNKRLDPRNHYDGEGKPCVAWHETPYYPKDCVDEFYVDKSDVWEDKTEFDLADEAHAARVNALMQKIILVLQGDGKPLFVSEQANELPAR